MRHALAIKKIMLPTLCPLANARNFYFPNVRLAWKLIIFANDERESFWQVFRGSYVRKSCNKLVVVMQEQHKQIHNSVIGKFMNFPRAMLKADPCQCTNATLGAVTPLSVH